MKKFFIFFLLLAFFSPLAVFSQGTITEKSFIENVQFGSYGTGTFPDAAFYKGEWWVVAAQGSSVNLYHGPDASKLSVFKSFPLSVSALAFPRITVHNGILWVAFRDEPGASYALKLWRSDTDFLETIASGDREKDGAQPSGQYPIAVGKGYIAWQRTENVQNGIVKVVIRPLVANKGSEVPIRDGKASWGPTRIISSSEVVLYEEESKTNWGINPWFAWPLVARENPDSGVNVRFNEEASTQFSIWSGKAQSPHAAAGPDGQYIVVMWSPDGGSINGINAATFTSKIKTLPAPRGIDLPPSKGDSFSANPLPPNPETILSLGELIQYIFLYGLYIVGMAVFVMIFWAGFIWFTAAGNASKISDAKSKIYNAIIGAILLLSAFLILYTINPDLVTGGFSVPGVPRTEIPDITKCNEVKNLPDRYYFDVAAAIEEYFKSNATVADSSASNASAVNSFLNGVVANLNAKKFKAGRVQECSGTALNPSGIIVGSSSDPAGEYYNLINTASTGTIRSSVSLRLLYHTEWSRLR